MSVYKWRMRHKYRYLHYYLTIDVGNIDDPLRIFANWGAGDTQLFTTSSSLDAPQTKIGYIDLSGYGIADNTWMRVWWDGICNGIATAQYYFESDFTSL